MQSRWGVGDITKGLWIETVLRRKHTQVLSNFLFGSQHVIKTADSADSKIRATQGIPRFLHLIYFTSSFTFFQFLGGSHLL